MMRDIGIFLQDEGMTPCFDIDERVFGNSPDGPLALCQCGCRFNLGGR